MAQSDASVLLAVQEKKRKPVNIAPRSTADSAEPEITEDVGESETTENKRARRTSGPEMGSEEWERQRRHSHKEVERRRREVINRGIDSLAALLPAPEKNKGKIIAQAVDYIQKMKVIENKNIEQWTIEKLLADQAISELTAQVESLKAENKRLRKQRKELDESAVDNNEDESEVAHASRKKSMKKKKSL